MSMHSFEVIGSSHDNMSSPIPISTDEISQYQIETALDNFSNLKTKVGEAVRAFLASVKFDTAKITNETLTRFLETHLENLNILFTEELFSDPEFFKNLAPSESSDKQSSSTNTPDVDTLSNAIIKEILPSIYENNVQLSTSAAQSSSKSAVSTSNITESNSSTQIPSKNVTALSPKTSITSIHRISYVSQMRTESTVLLGALAITLDKLQGITTTISRQAVVSTTVATAAPLMLSKKTPSIFKAKHKGLKLKNIFSKASILKVISPIGKMFTFLIKGSLKLLVGTVKLIGKSIVYVSKLIFNLAKTILDFGKQVFKKIGQGLAGLFKLVKNAFVFSAKRIGKIFKAVFIDSKIALVVLPYALGFIYGYIKTKFFSDSTFIDSLINIQPTLNTTLTEKDIAATKGRHANVEDAVDKSSSLPVPIQIFLNIIDGIFKKVGIKSNLQGDIIHYTNVAGVLLKGKPAYSQILNENKDKRQQRFNTITNAITKFSEENVGKGKVDILNDEFIQPLFKSIDTIFNNITNDINNIATINETIKSIIDSINNFNLDDFTKTFNEYSGKVEEITGKTIEDINTVLDNISGLIGAHAGGAVAGAALGILGLFSPVGLAAKAAASILGIIVGYAFGDSIGRYLRIEVAKIKTGEIYDISDERFLAATHKYLEPPTEVDSFKTLLETPLNYQEMPSDDSSNPSVGMPPGLTDMTRKPDNNSPLKPFVNIPAITPVDDLPESSDVDTTTKIKKPSKKQIRENLWNLIKTDSLDKDKTKLTPANINEILFNPNIQLSDLQEGPFEIPKEHEVWVDKARFKYIRSVLFNGILNKMIMESDTSENESFKYNEIFNIKYLFMTLSDPGSQLYKTVSRSVVEALSRSDSGRYLHDVINVMQDSPIKEKVPRLSYFKRNFVPYPSYLDVGLPIGILFNAIKPEATINDGTGKKMSAEGTFRAMLRSNNRPPNVGIITPNYYRGSSLSEKLISNDLTNTVLNELRANVESYYRRIAQQLEEFFAPDPEKEKTLNDITAANVYEETTKTNNLLALLDAKPKPQPEKPLAVSISTPEPPTPPVTNDTEITNIGFGGDIKSFNFNNINVFFKPVQFLG